MNKKRASRTELEFSRRAMIRLAAGGAALAAVGPTGAGLASAAGTPIAEGQPGGKLTWAWGRFPLTFNPLNYVGGIERWVRQLTTSRLINKDASGQIIPDFAETYEISADGLTYTFHLAKNATWSDGQPVTAKDVVFTYTWAADKRTGSTIVSYLSTVVGVAEFIAGSATSVSGLKALDDHTFQIQLTQPDATFLPFICGYYGPYLIPAHILSSVPPDQFDQSDYNTKTPRVGMGPYILSDAQKDQYLTFTRNDSFFKGKPLIDQFIIRIMQPDVALAALLKGEIDVTLIAAADYPNVQQDQSVRSYSYPVAGLWNGLEFNMTNDVVKDPRIHQAVLHALDRQTFVTKILNGLAAPTDSIYPQPQWLSPNIVTYGYDQDKARALLKDAGWDSNREVEWKYYAPFESLAPVLQQSLAQVGFKIKPVELDTAAWVDAEMKGDFEFTVVGGGGITDDPNELSDYFQCDVWSRYCNAQLLDLFKQGRATIDEAARKKIYDQIQEIVNRDLPWFPLYTVKLAVGFTKRVKEVAFTNYDYLYFEKWSVAG